MELAGDLVGGETGGAEFVDPIAEATQEAIAFGRFGSGWGVAGGDDSAAATAEVEPAFGGEGTVGFGDGVEVDAEVGGELADGGERVAGLEAVFAEGGAESVGDLAVGGSGRGEIDGEDGGH